MLAMSTLTSRSPGRYVSRSATIVRVTGSRREAAAQGALEHRGRVGLAPGIGRGDGRDQFVGL